MTDQQLRVLRRKHLLVLVRDLEEALQNAIDEKERLILAYQYGMEQQTAAQVPQPQWPARQEPVYPQQYEQQYEQQYPQPYDYTAPWQPNPWQ